MVVMVTPALPCSARNFVCADALCHNDHVRACDNIETGASLMQPVVPVAVDTSSGANTGPSRVKTITRSTPDNAVYRTAMSSSWRSMCVTSAQRSRDEFDIINFCSSGILLFFFVATGAACCRRCLQWKWLSAEAKQDVWALYGIFCALGSVGCAAGTIAFTCLMIGNM